MTAKLLLVSHPLCPYVQRAVIVAAEKGVAVERVFIDLSAKPDWFLALSPTGKVPLLRVTDANGTEHVLFESAAICEYLDETSSGSLLPADPLARARHRAFVEFASGTLAEIASLYGAADASVFAVREQALAARFARLEREIGAPWFDGDAFGLVDAAFAPVFRYLDAFERRAGVRLAEGLLKLTDWRAALAGRPSAAGAVSTDYPDRLAAFLLARNSELSARMRSFAEIGAVPAA